MVGSSGRRAAHRLARRRLRADETGRPLPAGPRRRRGPGPVRPLRRGGEQRDRKGGHVLRTRTEHCGAWTTVCASTPRTSCAPCSGAGLGVRCPSRRSRRWSTCDGSGRCAGTALTEYICREVTRPRPGWTGCWPGHLPGAGADGRRFRGRRSRAILKRAPGGSRARWSRLRWRDGVVDRARPARPARNGPALGIYDSARRGVFPPVHEGPRTCTCAASRRTTPPTSATPPR